MIPRDRRDDQGEAEPRALDDSPEGVHSQPPLRVDKDRPSSAPAGARADARRQAAVPVGSTASACGSEGRPDRTRDSK